jgi:hypothetical protein
MSFAENFKSKMKLKELLDVAPDFRDVDWEKSVLAALPEAQVRVLNAEPRAGPDGWPYLFVSDDDGADSEPLSQVLNWLSTRGIGLALNPQKEMPDFVLTYGMVWNFREHGLFLIEVTSDIRSGEIEISAGQEVLTAQPTEQYLPTYARAIVKQFLADQGAFTPKILMVSFDKKNYDLCFSIESLKSPPQQEQAGIAEAISWFLPAHYTVSLVSEKALPGFQLL